MNFDQVQKKLKLTQNQFTEMDWNASYDGTNVVYTCWNIILMLSKCTIAFNLWICVYHPMVTTINWIDLILLRRVCFLRSTRSTWPDSRCITVCR
jgi:hypothetical protein